MVVSPITVSQGFTGLAKPGWVSHSEPKKKKKRGEKGRFRGNLGNLRIDCGRSSVLQMARNGKSQLLELSSLSM